MFLEAVGALFKGAWNVLISINYPGTEIKIAAILLGAFLCVLSLKLIGFIMNFGFSVRGTGVEAIKKYEGLKKSRKGL